MNQVSFENRESLTEWLDNYFSHNSNDCYFLVRWAKNSEIFEEPIYFEKNLDSDSYIDMVPTIGTSTTINKYVRNGKFYTVLSVVAEEPLPEKVTLLKSMSEEETLDYVLPHIKL